METKSCILCSHNHSRAIRRAARIEVDRAEQAHEQLVYVLDAFTHVEHRRDALAEARRKATLHRD